MTSAAPLLECSIPEDLHVGEGSNSREGTSSVSRYKHTLFFISCSLAAVIAFEVISVGTPSQVWKQNSSMASMDSAVRHNVTYKLVAPRKKHGIADMIKNPDVMYANFGMVSLPVLGLSFKALFNYGVQQAFLLGQLLCQGRKAVKERLDSNAHFGKLSIGFQVIGQLSAAYSYIVITQATRPWQGGENLETFAFLVSQHSASITIIVGLSNNIVMPYFVDTFAECTIARTLTATGFCVGFPLWVSVVATGFPYNLMYILGAPVLGVLTFMLIFGTEKVTDRFSEVPTFAMCIMLVVGTFMLSLIWLALGVWSHPWYSLMSFGAFCVELLVPLFSLGILTIHFLEVDPIGVGYATFSSFGNALLWLYLLSMAVPTAILNVHGHTTDAEPLAFWGKKIDAYTAHTFMLPAQTAYASASEYSHVIAVWLSQIIGLPA